MRRSLPLAACAALAVAALVAGIATRLGAFAPSGAAARTGGPFKLLDGDGRTVAGASFRGRWMLVHFGHAHPPDARPTALQDITTAPDQLDPASRAKVAQVSMTVDPGRGTPAVVRDYAAAFGPSFTGLSGSPDALAQAARERRVHAARRPTADGGHEMDHCSVICVVDIRVMDPAGRFVANFACQGSPDAIAGKLKQLGV